MMHFLQLIRELAKARGPRLQRLQRLSNREMVCCLVDPCLSLRATFSAIFGLKYKNLAIFQMFKFPVSFATEEEKTDLSMDVLIEVQCSTKDLKRAIEHLSPPTNNVRDSKSLLLSWETCILV